MYAGIFMIPSLAIRSMESSRAPNSRICRIPGPARSAAWARTSFRRNSNNKNSKHETRNPKQIQMIEIQNPKQIEIQNSKQYDLEDRTLSKKDFVMRVKICRKESKETRLWLNLCDINNDKELEKEQNILIKESTELMNIFGAIIRKSE